MDPKKLWQTQPKESPQITIYRIRRKAEQLHRKTRREQFNSALGQLIVIAICVGGTAINPGLWAPGIAFAIALIWAIVGVWISRRDRPAPPMPGDGGFETGIEFYRQEIRRQRVLFRRWMIWSLGPIVLSTSALIAIPLTLMFRTVPESLLYAAPALLCAFFVWAIGWPAIIKRRKRELEREIDELNEIEKESKS